MPAPLAERLRPDTIEDVVGQTHLIGEGKILSNILKVNEIPNMIFYGPSGTGKTTVANICAKAVGKNFFKLNATTAAVKDIKEIFSILDEEENKNGVLLYLDEIQNFNKKQQQTLLEYIENGKITLIASTTENPYFYVYNAILSRSTVLEFKKVEPFEILKAVHKGVEKLNEDYPKIEITIDDDAANHISLCSNGDVRKSLNALEMCVKSQLYNYSDRINITLNIAEDCTQLSSFSHDRSGDNHYDVISAFQKSIRGSDADAALHYLARLLEGGDLITACRRLLVVASEDIGLANPNAIVIAKACVDSAFQLGLPEARIPLAQAVILLANSPKSNSAICAIDAAISDIRTIDVGGVPGHLKDAHYSGAQKMGHGTTYKYPHNYKNSYVSQQYLPDRIKDKVYYNAGNNKNEQLYKKYIEEIKRGGNK